LGQSSTIANPTTKSEKAMPKVVSKIDVSSELALALVQGAVAHARSQGWEVSAAVCDARGVLLAFLRTDNCGDPSAGFAIDKAFTAATMRRSTKAFGERAQEKPLLRTGLANRERLLVFPGGLPLLHEGSVIGAIGVSGARDEQDIECAITAAKGAGISCME
jgi:uncharacterized protein GlcG (DUF336 family)